MAIDPEDSATAADFRPKWRDSFETYAWVSRTLLNVPGRTAAKRLAACLCGKNIVSMFMPWFLGKLIGAAMLHQAKQARTMFLGIVLTSAATWLFQRYEGRFREVVFGENMGSINLRVNELFLEKSLGQHLRESALLSSSGMEKGRNRALESMNLISTEAVEAVFLLATSYIALWFVSTVAGVVTTGIFLICGLWALYLNGKVAEVCAPLDVLFRRWHRHLAECWEHVERVKANGKEQVEASALATDWEDMLGKDRTFWLWFLSQASLRYLVSSIALFFVLYWTIESAERTGQGIDQIFPLFVWMRAILDNIWRLGNVEHRLGWNSMSINSLKEALTLTPDVVVEPGAKKVDTSQGIEIELDDVGHIYHPSKLKEEASTKKPRVTRPVLNGVSFTIKRGDRVALIGPSGAGKTSIMRLIQRAFDPESGRVLINGVDLRKLDLRSWLEAIGYIPQKTTAIFEGSLRSNLVHGLTVAQQETMTDDFLWSLIERLKIADRMEDGLDTLLGKGGVELSGGEAQRVMVVAALAKCPQFFLIDEATSALDSTTERAVQVVFEEVLTGDVGALIIAHRLSTVRRICNRFIVLRPVNDDGEPQIEAIADSFEELYRISPTFRALVDDQGISIAA